jgi:hypothetical protein
VTDLNGIKQKKKKMTIFFQNGRLKKTEFFNHHQELSNCRQNIRNWSLGEWDQLMPWELILLNLYGHQAV